VQPIRNAFQAVGDRPLEAAATLRASPWQAFWRVALPLASPGFLSAAVLGFSHTVGNFGVVLMIGGNIPDRTRVMSTAIFDYVETMRWHEANILAGGMVVFAFVVILSMILIEKRFAGART
jgi:molybdate transport system permease protein